MRQFEFVKHLESGSIAPIYLFVGEADFLMEEAWNLLLDKIVPAKARHFNGERLQAKEQTAAQVTARLSTLPMFGSRQLLMVQHIEAWPKEQRILLASYLARPNPASCLVLTATQRKGLEKIEAAVSAVGAVVDFPPLSEKDVPGWLRDRASKHHGKILSPQAAAFLGELVGCEMHSLMQELEKLSIYVGNRERIEMEDVKQTVSSYRSFSVFELLRHIGQRQSQKAVHILRKLMVSGEAPLAILGLLARQVRMLWQVKDGLERGMSAQQIGKLLNLYPTILKNYTQQASSFTTDDLRRTHGALRDADLALKSTGVSPEVVLEALVLRLCLGRSEKPLP